MPLPHLATQCCNDSAQVAKQSNAARSMCLWVRALDVYGRMVKVVEPKRQALHHAESALAEVEAQLTAKRGQLRCCTAQQCQLEA